MFEFLQLLADAVARAVPAIAKKKERDASAKLGADLFLVYVQFNEALVLAEEIVRSLEDYVTRMSEHLRTGDDSHALTAGDWVTDKIHQQVRNLTAVRDRLTSHAWELQVLDGQSSNELEFLLDHKMSALKALSSVVDRERLPLRTTGVLIDDQGTLQVEPFIPRLNHYRELERDLMANSVPLNAQWTLEILIIVKRYLTFRKPREQLDEIRASLEKIRSALETHFTITDVLLRAGDPRAGRPKW